MATHDYIISNASGAAVRADLNNALAAIATNNSSATEPTTTYAYQWWADTGSSPTVMKLRNAANSGWVTLFQLDGEWTVVPFENGTAAAPSIYFKDSGTDTGIYSPGTDQVAITTGGTQRATVDSSGRLLVGTSSSLRTAGLIQIAGTSYPAVDVNSFGTTTNPELVLRQAKGTQSSPTIVASGDSLGKFIFQGYDGSTYQVAAAIECQVDGTPGANDMPGRIILSTTADGASSSTERMRIKQDGAISIQSGAFEFTTAHLFIGGSRMPYNVGNLTMQWSDSTGRVSITTSTRLLKKDIEDSPYGIEAVKALQPRTYTIHDKEGESEKTEIGFIADEVADVIPEIVPWSRKSLITGNDEDEELIPISVQYDRISVVLVKALQEAIAKIEVLEAKVAALEAN